MRFLHTADWHIGRRLYGYDLTEAQKTAFAQIEQIALDQHVDGILLAGDLYDRSLPAETAVTTLNEMIQKLNLTDHLPIYAISGNHDSATRLATGAPWYPATQFYMVTQLEAAFKPIELADTQIFSLPYFEPFAAQQYFDDAGLVQLDQCVAAVVAKMKTKFDPTKKHILIAHFFVSGSATTDSETQLTVGGLAAVPAATLRDFDYVALGHLHGKDALHEPKMRYSGSPVKFSLSEAQQQKGVFIVDTEPFQLTFIPLKPLHDVHKLTASFDELMTPAFYEALPLTDYFGLTLTDVKPIPDVMARLKTVYKNILSLDRANGYTLPETLQQKTLEHKAPLTLLSDFYEEIAKEDLTEKQLQWAKKALAEANKAVE
ncbi:exonuclease SbcCD subunit D [Agrilactobacillus yilanensis]|uniref:Nuclease SbcCD subunit D n=1 Tax=Agrilactobacillus yilanensis TaxID=2485997 RepID=A0ABW4J9R7_9LACO|nr:exonuclease SbcCD subunit D [Agrilactobacillus yilanensis]